MGFSFVMTGGGTGGHVIPAIAVARVLRDRGHRLLFIGTKEGMEARLVPEAGFEIEFIQSGGLNRVGLVKQLQTATRLPLGLGRSAGILRRFGAAAVFSTGGFVAGPVSVSALLLGKPLVIMEPNAVPGFANRKIAKRVHRALLGFEETLKWFPPAAAEVTGLPVRREFFENESKQSGPFTVLVTGGSRGARTLNRAGRESWPLFRNSGSPVRIVHQTGPAEYDALVEVFR
ncbi:MAG: glycosyltransferase, partial [Acidobacteriaceae bacterium]|nr:glycosyltransferase [Acidobacteriaceae bacterium]